MGPLRTVLCFLVAACSNGSGGPAALRVTSQSPAPGSVAEADASVRLVFDRDPDVATLTADALVVNDASGPIAGSHAYDPATRTWTWTAQDELPRGALVTAVVAESVRTVDRAGLLGVRSWTFRVRQAAPSAPLAVRDGAVVTGALFVTLRQAGQAVVAAGPEMWWIDRDQVGFAEGTPVLQVGAMHVDDAGGVVVAGPMSGPGGAIAGCARRNATGLWYDVTAILDDPAASLVGYRLHGNGRGDALLHGLLGYPPASYTRHHLRRSARDVLGWQDLPEVLLQAGDDALSCLDERGFVSTLRSEGDFVVAERHAPDGTMATYTVASGPFLRVESLTTSADGTLRMLWHAPGRARQRLLVPGSSFGPATDVPVGIPSWSQWRSAPTGAVVGWNGTAAFRSEAGSSDWVQTTLAQEPLAAAISPRGEAVFVSFELPDQVLMVRWRAGELPDAPVPIAVIPSAFNAQRRAAVAVDGAGRVIVAFVPDVPGDLVAIRVQ